MRNDNLVLWKNATNKSKRVIKEWKIKSVTYKYWELVVGSPLESFEWPDYEAMVGHEGEQDLKAYK